MYKEISTEILIESTPENVWRILTNFDQYPTWNPFIKSLQGSLRVGGKLTVRIEPPQTKGMTFKPTVLSVETNHGFSWRGRVLFKGIFNGDHRFELFDNHDGTITFKHSEQFTGILVPFLGKQLENNTKRGFEEMNRALKVLAESSR